MIPSRWPFWRWEIKMLKRHWWWRWSVALTMRLLVLNFYCDKFNREFKLNSCIPYITPNYWEMVGAFYRCKKYLIPSSSMIYKSRIIKNVAFSHYFPALIKYKKRLRGLVGDRLFFHSITIFPQTQS